MPQIPRYESFQQGTGGGAQISPQTAAAPGRAAAGLGNQIRTASNEFLRAKVEAERTAEVADRLSGAMQAMEDWTTAQDPYDQQGKPRFDRLQGDADKAWGGIYKQAMDGVRDPVVTERLDLRLKDYHNRKRIEVTATANKWEVGHRQGQLESSLYKFSDLASRATSYDQVERYLADAQHLLKGSMQSGIVSPEGAAKLERKFSQDMMTGYVRTQIYSGNYQEAAATLRDMWDRSPGEALASDTYKTLSAELRSESDRVRKAQEAQRKQALDGYITNILLRAKQGESTIAELDNLAATGVLSDPNTYNTMRSALETAGKGIDDPDKVRWFWHKAATEGVDGSDLAAMMAHTSVGTFQGMSNLVMSSHTGGGAGPSMFDNDVFKKGLSYLTDRLRTTGPMQAMNDAERRVVPAAERDFMMAMTRVWNETGTLELADVMQAAEEIAQRGELALGVGATGPGAYALPPRYKSDDAVEAAYAQGAFGEVGTAEARKALAYELDAIRLFQRAQEIKAEQERKKAGRWKGGQ